MIQEKYIGMDVHQAATSAAVMDVHGKLLMECLLETKASTIVEFVQGLQGPLSLTFEEGTSAAWLHDLLKPHVSRLVVCDPRKAALLKEGNKSDRIDARKLAELLRTNQLKPVYHGEHGIRSLKELGRSYLTITKDVTRVMNRIKALYRGWGIACTGSSVYSARHRAEWLADGSLRDFNLTRKPAENHCFTRLLRLPRLPFPPEAPYTIPDGRSKQERLRVGERVRAGLARVRNQGKRLGRPPLRQLSRSQVAALRKARRENKSPFRTLAKNFGISVFTAHRLCKTSKHR